MTAPERQGRRSADHIALLGLTEITNRNPGGDKTKASTRIFVGGSLAPRPRPVIDVPPVIEAPEPRPADDRQRDADLRKQAATLLGEGSESTQQRQTATTEEPEKISPFALAAMLLLAGLIFSIVIPPVGLTFLLCAVIPIVWAAGSAVLRSSS